MRLGCTARAAAPFPRLALRRGCCAHLVDVRYHRAPRGGTGVLGTPVRGSGTRAGSGAPKRDRASAQVLENPGMWVKCAMVVENSASSRASSCRRRLSSGAPVVRFAMARSAPKLSDRTDTCRAEWEELRQRDGWPPRLRGVPMLLGLRYPRFVRRGMRCPCGRCRRTRRMVHYVPATRRRCPRGRRRPRCEGWLLGVGGRKLRVEYCLVGV